MRKGKFAGTTEFETPALYLSGRFGMKLKFRLQPNLQKLQK